VWHFPEERERERERARERERERGGESVHAGACKKRVRVHVRNW